MREEDDQKIKREGEQIARERIRARAQNFVQTQVNQAIETIAEEKANQMEAERRREAQVKKEPKEDDPRPQRAQEEDGPELVGINDTFGFFTYE